MGKVTWFLGNLFFNFCAAPWIPWIRAPLSGFLADSGSASGIGPDGFVLANANWAADQANPLGLNITLPNLSKSLRALLPKVTAPPLTKLLERSSTTSKVLGSSKI